MLRQTALGPASQIDIGRSEGQRVYHNNKPLYKYNVYCVELRNDNKNFEYKNIFYIN